MSNSVYDHIVWVREHWKWFSASGCKLQLFWAAFMHALPPMNKGSLVYSVKRTILYLHKMLPYSAQIRDFS